MCIGQKIRLIREKLKLSQEAVARSAGISTTYLSNIECGKNTNVGIETLGAIATSLQTDLIEFFKSKKAKQRCVSDKRTYDEDKNLST